MKTLSKFMFTILLCASFLAIQSCDEKKKENDKETSEARAEANYELAENNTSTTCDCDSSWFPHAQTPPPAEGANSPFAASSTTNCIFHQWSWQKFLWLTKPDTSGKPLFLNEMIQIDEFMTPVTVPSNVSIALTADEQAGFSSILKTNPNFNTSGKAATVYYALYTNSTMMTAANNYVKELQNGSLQPNNTATFPVGSLEMKTSWVDVSVIPEAELGKYYTTQATINGTQTEVAMLGMHVVGVVENHPEFIWATFEHESLSPAFNWEESTVSATSDVETLLFKKGTVTNINGIVWDSNTSAPMQADEASILFQYGVPRVQAAKFEDSFMKTSQSEPENFNNITNINSCVTSQFAKNDAKSAWQYYQYSGSIWVNTDGMSTTQQVAMLREQASNLGKADSTAVARGSLNAANITMETFTQTFNHSMADINVNNLANCFSCHNAQSFSTGKPTSVLYISHAFNGLLEHSKGHDKAKIEKLKMEEFKKTFLK